MSEEIQQGTLYIIPTPIGNLEDITYRAVHILSRVNVIAAEDTRKTGILLDHYKIRQHLISFYSHNETVRIPQIIDRLRSGEAVAVVSDAGTPGISDPAHSLITAVIAEGFSVIALPGATALIPALVGSGLPSARFVFEGFLPHKKGRQTALQRIAEEKRTVVMYESTHRLLKVLEELLHHCGDRNIAVCREISKKFEEIQRGTVSDVLAYFSTHSIKGEFVIVMEGKIDSE